jgi:hypothetical protein
MQEKIKNTATEVNSLLDEYIKIHNEVFKFSLRKIIPIPFIFKALNFEKLHDRTKKVLTALENANKQIRELLNESQGDEEQKFSQLLSEYCCALITTVAILEKMLFQLNLKSKNSGDYNLSEHNRLFNSYREATDKYYDIGIKLNESYSKISK